MSLKALLENRKCFKLICAAGNENTEQIEYLVSVYAKAGCRFFDIGASEKAIQSAKKGLEASLSKEEIQECNICISVGAENDPHLKKVRIDKKKCVECKKCYKCCPQEAIKKKLKVEEEKCIGCMKCFKACKYGAIEIYSKTKPLKETLLPLLEKYGSFISCIELHSSTEDEIQVEKDWRFLNENFDGFLSLCIDRAKLSNEKIIERIKTLIKDKEPYSVIIQADGAPMSGGEDDFKTTLQAVAMAEIIQNENLPVYLLLSGGTNSKTALLAELCKIKIDGVAIGSFARKIVKDKGFDQAVEIATELIETVQD